MRNEHGFSMVEMLLASGIALLLLSGAMTTFNHALGLTERVAGMGDLEQNVRTGMGMLVSDFISAGWLIPVGGLPVPSGAGATAVARPGPGSLTFATKINSVNPGNGLGPTINSMATDIVNILYADNELRLDQASLTAIGTNVTSITVSNTLPISGEGVLQPIQAGDLIALSNTNGNAVQYVTGVTGQQIFFASGASDKAHLNQPSIAAGSVQSLRNSGTTTIPVATTIARRVWLVTYFMNKITDSTRPRLMRQINYRTPEAVALVMEDLQLSYDVVDNVTNPADQAAPGTPSQIRKANILLTGRSTWQDRNSSEFLRRSLTTQVSLRSLSFTNRYK